MPASSPWLAYVIAALAAIGPFSIDTYLPVFPAIAAALGASALEMQQTLTAYMANFSFMVLWHGALADRYGRRRVILVATGLFAAASLVCAAVAANFDGFFLYVLAAPHFVLEHLGLGPHEFPWLCVPAMSGMMGGALLSGRVAGRWTAQRTIGVGFVLMAGAAAVNLLVSALREPGVPWSVLPISGYPFGMALAMPSLTLLALDLFPARRGLASSCLSFVHVGLDVITAGALVPLLWGTPLTLAAGMAGFLGLGGVAFAGWRRAQTRGAA